MRKLSFGFVDLNLGESWKLTYNKLSSLDPEENDLSEMELEYYVLGLLTEDLLQIENSKRALLIDVGWYPDSEPTGNFVLLLLNIFREGGANWEAPLFKFETRSLAILIEEIYRITSQDQEKEPYL